VLVEVGGSKCVLVEVTVCLWKLQCVSESWLVFVN
jgi:hypothetical protein